VSEVVFDPLTNRDYPNYVLQALGRSGTRHRVEQAHPSLSVGEGRIRQSVLVHAERAPEREPPHEAPLRWDREGTQLDPQVARAFADALVRAGRQKRADGHLKAEGLVQDLAFLRHRGTGDVETDLRRRGFELSSRSLDRSSRSYRLGEPGLAEQVVTLEDSGTRTVRTEVLLPGGLERIKQWQSLDNWADPVAIIYNRLERLVQKKTP
jgi:hypothetical protein